MKANKMEKTDKSIKDISIAAIKRHTISPIDFEYSTIYEADKQISNQKIKNAIQITAGEELICSTIISEVIWTVLTSRRIITWEGVRKIEHNLKGLIQRDMGDFKGWSKQKYTKGFLHFDDNKIIPIFIETSNASMIMIYGTNTAIKINSNQEQ